MNPAVIFSSAYRMLFRVSGFSGIRGPEEFGDMNRISEFGIVSPEFGDGRGQNASGI